MIELRTYQREAVDAVYAHLRSRDDNPCVVIPTGGGKTPVMAQVCLDTAMTWGGRALVLAHVKELLEQTARTLKAMAPELDLGLYSAGLGRRDTEHAVIVAGIQSVYRRAAELDSFDLILIDEAHMIPPDGEGMYRTFLEEARLVNPNVRLIGLTATPYRMATGMICAPDHLLNHVCYEVGVKELIVHGYLCPLKTKAGVARADTSGLHLRAGEFVAAETAALMDTDELVRAACAEIVEHTRDRSACLIFATGIEHGLHVQRVLREEHGVTCECVFGHTPSAHREELLARFRGRQEGLFTEPLSHLVNVNVLTTGFDAPNVDCVAMLRPTNSPGLYYQMCLDMETEVLTSSGWRRCHEVAVGDRVAAFDVESEEIVYGPTLGKVHRALRPHESMYGVAAPHIDIRVTDQHDLVVRSKSKSAVNWRIQQAAEVALRRDTYTIPVAGSGANHNADAPLTDAEVSFLGWFLTDGYHHPANDTVSIAQSPEKYAEEVRGVLEACGFGWREYAAKRTGNNGQHTDGLLFVIPRGQPRGANGGLRGWGDLHEWIDKDIPAVYETLSTRQFGILLDAMNLGNGRLPGDLPYRKRTMDITVGCRQRMADRIQQMAIERGFRCNVAEFRPAPNGWNSSPQKQWMIHVRKQPVAYVGGTAKRENALVPNRCRLGPVEHEANEWVWCLTTEKGTLVTRRNGKVAILGNCGRGFRTCPGKEDCLVLDFGGNVLRHGPVDQVRVEKKEGGDGEAPAKECPECHSVVACGYRICPDCGYEFPPPERQKHEAKASTAGILSGQVTVSEYDVHAVVYGVHHKHDAPSRPPPHHARGIRDRLAAVAERVDLFRAHRLGAAQGRVLVAAAHGLAGARDG